MNNINPSNLHWFSQVYREEKGRMVDCLVDLSISSIPELNDGFWLIREEDRLVLKQAGKIGSGVVLGKANRWSVDLW